jgi:hypothetical protein
VTGIPLPFVSVGGSSLVTNLLGIGVLQAIHAAGDDGECQASARPARRSSSSCGSFARRTTDRRPLVLGGARSLVDALAPESSRATGTRVRCAR